jgi:hypothetical protein
MVRVVMAYDDNGGGWLIVMAGVEMAQMGYGDNGGGWLIVDNLNVPVTGPPVSHGVSGSRIRF